MLTLKSQRGDTIVEVMLSLAILGLALGITYSTANRSLQATRQAQETSEASRYAQTQVEAVRAHAGELDPATPANIIDPLKIPGNFCYKSDGSLDKTGAPCQFAGFYSFVNTYNAATSTLKVVGTWDDVNGLDTDATTLYYRLYK